MLLVFLFSCFICFFGFVRLVFLEVWAALKDLLFYPEFYPCMHSLHIASHRTTRPHTRGNPVYLLELSISIWRHSHCRNIHCTYLPWRKDLCNCRIRFIIRVCNLTKKRKKQNQWNVKLNVKSIVCLCRLLHYACLLCKSCSTLELNELTRCMNHLSSVQYLLYFYLLHFTIWCLWILYLCYNCPLLVFILAVLFGEWMTEEVISWSHFQSTSYLFNVSFVVNRACCFGFDHLLLYMTWMSFQISVECPEGFIMFVITNSAPVTYAHHFIILIPSYY